MRFRVPAVPAWRPLASGFKDVKDRRLPDPERDVQRADWQIWRVSQRHSGARRIRLASSATSATLRRSMFVEQRQRQIFPNGVQRNGRPGRLRSVVARRVEISGTIPGGMDDDFALFYRDAYPGAVRLAWLLTHDHAAAEDVVQDAFMRLRPRLATIEHRNAYLRTAIVNGCRDQARSAGRADAGLRRIGVGAEVSSTDQPSELLDVVARLSYKQRAVLVLRYWADLPEGEIAEIVGARPATVRSINARALARLSKELPR